MSDNLVKGPKDDIVDFQDRYESKYPSAIAGQKRSRDSIGYNTDIPASSQEDPFGPKKRKKIDYSCDICHGSAVNELVHLTAPNPQSKAKSRRLSEQSHILNQMVNMSTTKHNSAANGTQSLADAHNNTNADTASPISPAFEQNQELSSSSSTAAAISPYEAFIQQKIAQFQYRILSGAMTPVGEDEMARLTAFYEDYARNRMKLPEGMQAPGGETANNAQDAKLTATELSPSTATKTPGTETANSAEDAKRTATQFSLNITTTAPEPLTSLEAASNVSGSHLDTSAEAMESTLPEETPEGEIESFEDYARRIMGLPKGTKVLLADEIMKEEEEENGPTPEEAAANLRRVLEELSDPASDANASQFRGDAPTWPTYPPEDIAAANTFLAAQSSGYLGGENGEGGQEGTIRTPAVTVQPGDGKRWGPIMERDLGECSVEKMIAQVAREGQKIDGLLELMKTTTEYDDVDVLEGEE